MNAITFLLIRVSHVLLAAIWLGAVVYTAVFVMPAVAESGPAGGQVMGAIARRGLTAFLGVVAGLTIVSGVWLYWRFTGGFDPAVSASTGGMAFGIGGAAGILAGVVGGAVVGRSANELMASAGRMASVPEGPERGALAQRMAALRQRMATGTYILIVLQVIAVALMAIGHYI